MTLRGAYVFLHQDTLQPLSMQALPAGAESLCIVEMGRGEGAGGSAGGLFLNIGLQNGVLLRTALDSVTGDLSDTRTRSLLISVCLPRACHIIYIHTI